MERDGRLGRERLETHGEFAAGDRVVCRRNSDRLGVRNGTRGTVEAIDREQQSLCVVTDRGDRIVLPAHYLEAGHVRRGYALTGHAAQGLTVERAFVLGSGEGRLQEWGYVALSRARETTRLYVTASAPESESHFHELDERGPVTLLAQALEESAAEQLAVDQPAPAGPRHRPRPEIERLLERQRLSAEKSRALAERRLAAAEQALAARLFGGRGRRGWELRTEVTRQRAALRLADERLADLDRQAAAPHPMPSLAEDRPRGRTRPLERAPSLDLGL